MIADILKNSFENVFEVFITTGLLWCIAFIGYYAKRHDLFFNQVFSPSDRVLKCEKIDFDHLTVIEDKEKFANIFTEDEQKQLVIHSSGKKLFNGNMVRLKNVNGNSCVVQRVRYFDFLTTNLLFRPAGSKLLSFRDVVWHMVYDEDFRKRNKLENRLKARIAWYGKLDTFDKVLKVDEFANAIAVSVVLYDKQDNVLVVRRGNKNAISSGNFAVSATGSVSLEDLEKVNPFISAGCREVKEELNLDIELNIKELIIVKQKFQPVVLLEGRVEQNFADIVEKIKNAPDYKDENTQIYAVPVKKIRNVVRKYKFTDTSAYQLTGKCSTISWFVTRKKDISEYEL